MSEVDKVVCMTCGTARTFTAGYLTEAQKRDYRCEACSQPVVENQVTTRDMQRNGKRILTEDLPQ